MTLKFKKVKGKEIVFMTGRGSNCTCPDCPVLYGGECWTTAANNRKARAAKKAKTK